MIVSRGVARADPEATVDAAPRSPTGYFTIGASRSPDDGWIFKTEVGQRDLFQTGQQLSLSAELSAVRQEAALRHVLPLGDGLALRSELFTRDRDYFAFHRAGTGGDLELGQQLGRATRVFVKYGAEYVTVSALADPLAVERHTAEPGSGARGDRGQLLTTLGAGVRYDTRDGRGLSGSRLELVGEVSQPALGSAASFTRVRAIADTARTFGRLTLRLHGHAGYVHSNDPAGVPLSERLFDEGNLDVRGYALGHLGAPLGDSYEAIGRAEVELAVSRRAGLSVALFADAGVRGNRDPSFGPVGSSLARSVGASLIWRGPIGPVRLDFAVPLDGGRDRQALLWVGFNF